MSVSFQDEAETKLTALDRNIRNVNKKIVSNCRARWV